VRGGAQNEGDHIRTAREKGRTPGLVWVTKISEAQETHEEKKTLQVPANTPLMHSRPKSQNREGAPQIPGFKKTEQQQGEKKTRENSRQEKHQVLSQTSPLPPKNRTQKGKQSKRSGGGGSQLLAQRRVGG